MNGLFGLSVNPALYGDSFQNDMLLGTFYLQHIGEEDCGFSVCNGRMTDCVIYDGPIRKNFNFSKNYGQFQDGKMGVGFCGSKPKLFQGYTRFGRTSVIFTGNINNRSEIIKNLVDTKGFVFRSESNAELVAMLISYHGRRDAKFGIEKIKEIIEGAYSFLMMTPEGIYAVCGLDGHWPLTVGRKDGAVAVSSESGGFSNLGFVADYEVKPGETIFLKEGNDFDCGCETGSGQLCSFLLVYTSFPASLINGIPVSVVRKRLGACLAQKDIAEGFIPDIVAAVPYSGQLCSVGYHQEFVRQANQGLIKKIPLYDEVLFKYSYAGRSYTPSNQEDREREAYLKILASSEDYRGKKAVVGDDSIVRGTQARSNLIPKLKRLGFKEIHLRISNPELLSHCPWGKSTKKGELLADRMPSNAEKEEFLEINSLKYNTIDDLVESIGMPREQLCLDCDLR